jgi:hypothetical protein
VCYVVFCNQQIPCCDTDICLRIGGWASSPNGRCVPKP